MKQKILHYAKELIFVLIFMSIVANLLSLYKSQELNDKPLRYKEFHLIDNSDYKVENDKPLLVHFWATWCPTCKLEADNIDRLSNYYNVITIAVNSGSDYEINNYLKEHDLNFKVVNDKNSDYSKEFNIGAFPTTLIYDQDKNLVFSEVGYTSTLGLYIRLLWASL
ncbi:MAG: redoxin family protein [Sulfurimonas sp.]